MINLPYNTNNTKMSSGTLHIHKEERTALWKIGVWEEENESTEYETMSEYMTETLH